MDSYHLYLQKHSQLAAQLGAEVFVSYTGALRKGMCYLQVHSRGK